MGKGDHLTIVRKEGWYARTDMQEIGPFSTEIEAVWAADRRARLAKTAKPGGRARSQTRGD